LNKEVVEEKIDAIPDSLTGFTKSDVCYTNLILCMYSMLYGRDMLKQNISGNVDIIFIDLKSAYDTVNRRLLNNRLKE